MTAGLLPDGLGPMGEIRGPDRWAAFSAWLAARPIRLHVRRLGREQRRVAVFGSDRLSHATAAFLRTDGRTKLAGVFTTPAGNPTLPDDLAELCRRNALDYVILATSPDAPDDLQRFATLFQALDVGLLAHAGSDAATPGWPTGPVLAPPPPGGMFRLGKAAIDRLSAAAALLLLWPLFLLVMLAIRVDSPGPVLFTQARYGRGGRPFRILKFRTMRWTADVQDGCRQTERGDRRVTRVGDFLRRTSLDELPQLLNVLTGAMSLVGPRPHPMAMRTGGRLGPEVTADYMRRYRVKPGMTGLAQINGHRGATATEADLRARLAEDLRYIAARSVWLDLRILLLTPVRLVRHRGQAF